MTDSKKVLLLGGAALLGFFYFAKKAAVGLLNYYVAGIQARMDGFTPILTLEVAIQNPSNQDYIINSFVGNLSSNGYLIGNVSSFVQTRVLPSSQTIYPLEVRLSLIAIASDVYNAITSGTGASQIVTFDGIVNASGIVAPVKMSYKIL